MEEELQMCYPLMFWRIYRHNRETVRTDNAGSIETRLALAGCIMCTTEAAFG